jgi:FkbM family methyltransferase
MKLLRNAKTLLAHPKISWNYINYQASRLTNAGQAIRLFPTGIAVKGWSGFSEFHSAESYMTPAESHFFQTFPFETGNLIDVGANLGVISLTLAKRFPNQSFHAFEPNPSTFEALQQNIALNRCPNIKAQPLVVSDRNGSISFDANPIHRGTTHIATEGQFLIDLPCITLDTYAEQEEISNIAFLKIDVEGYEEQVFLGAKELLKQQKIRVIYYEVCPENARKANLEPNTPTQLLQEYGYSVYKLGSKTSFHPINDFDFNQVTLDNWIALSIDSQQKLYKYICQP